MPREPSITQEQVNAAANAIRAAGAKPTARAVRALLGNGSMNTVLGFLRAWQADAGAPEGATRLAQLEHIVDTTTTQQAVANRTI